MLISASTLMRFSPPDLTEAEWALREADAEAEARALADMERRRRMSKSRIPLGFRRASIGDDRVRAWAADPTVGLLLQGEPGRGKTHNGCAALIELAKARTVEFATLKGLLDECKATFGDRARTERSVMLRLYGVDVLMVDDLGSERLTEWSLPVLFDVIDSRWANERPTIVTTNLTTSELLERVGRVDAARAKALVSRLATYDHITLGGVDRRLS